MTDDMTDDMTADIACDTRYDRQYRAGHIRNDHELYLVKTISSTITTGVYLVGEK
jgi:hypothetical protein